MSKGDIPCDARVRSGLRCVQDGLNNSETPISANIPKPSTRVTTANPNAHDASGQIFSNSATSAHAHAHAIKQLQEKNQSLEEQLQAERVRNQRLHRWLETSVGGFETGVPGDAAVGGQWEGLKSDVWW